MKGKRNTILAILLFASILGNVFFAGMYAGKKAHTERHDWRPLPMRDFYEVAQDLSPENRDLFIATMEDLRSGGHFNPAKMRKKRQKILEIFIADEFDPVAFEAEVKKLHSHRHARKEKIVKLISNLATKLSAEDRKTLAPHMRIVSGPPHLRGGKHGHPGGRRH